MTGSFTFGKLANGGVARTPDGDETAMSLSLFFYSSTRPPDGEQQKYAVASADKQAGSSAQATTQ